MSNSTVQKLTGVLLILAGIYHIGKSQGIHTGLGTVYTLTSFLLLLAGCWYLYSRGYKAGT